MGDVITFTRTSFNLRKASRHLGEVCRTTVANAALLQQTQQHLRAAASHGEQVLAKLDECQELLDWTDRFCSRCLAATDLVDLEEMVRQRDALVEARQQQAVIERSIESLRIAAAR
jgi:hypothetical protein